MLIDVAVYFLLVFVLIQSFIDVISFLALLLLSLLFISWVFGSRFCDLEFELSWLKYFFPLHWIFEYFVSDLEFEILWCHKHSKVFCIVLLLLLIFKGSAWIWATWLECTGICFCHDVIIIIGATTYVFFFSKFDWSVMDARWKSFLFLFSMLFIWVNKCSAWFEPVRVWAH